MATYSSYSFSKTILQTNESVQITIKFTEPVPNFDYTNPNHFAAEGHVNGATSTDGGLTWVIDFTTGAVGAGAPVYFTTKDFTPAGVDIHNIGARIDDGDQTPPTVTVSYADKTLDRGQVTPVTFTFSEKVTSFDLSDVTSPAGGSLAGLTTTDNITWTAQYTTPTNVATDTSLAVVVTNASYTDQSVRKLAGTGNQGTAIVNAPVDSTPPTVVVSYADTTLEPSQTTTVSFTFSEVVTNFILGDVDVPVGDLTNLRTTDGIHWIADYTAPAAPAGTVLPATVLEKSYEDLAGNVGSQGQDTATINAAPNSPPQILSITFADNTLKSEQTTQVTFTFNEAVTGFTLDDVQNDTTAGTLSGLTSTNGVTWTATYTPEANVAEVEDVLRVDAGTYTDLLNLAGTTDAQASVGVDSAAPMLDIVIDSDTLTVGQTTAVTFTFNEPVTGFTLADVAAPNGTLSNLTSADGGQTYTAVFTAAAPTAAAGDLVKVANGSFEDLYGNIGIDNASDGDGGDGDTANSIAHYAIASNNVAPNVSVSFADDTLWDGQTTTVTFKFTEAVTGFDLSDVANNPSAGTLAGLTTTDNVTWTAVYTSKQTALGDHVTMTESLIDTLSVKAGSYTDTDGLAGTAGSDKAAVDEAPLLQITAQDSTLVVGQTTTMFFTFSENVSGFDLSDVRAPTGMQLVPGTFATTDNIHWTADYKAVSALSGNAKDPNSYFQVAAGSYFDGSAVGPDGNAAAGAAGAGAGTAGGIIGGGFGAGMGASNGGSYYNGSSVAMGPAASAPTVTISMGKNCFKPCATSKVTFAFSEAVTGFTLSDVKTGSAGKLSHLTTADGGKTWTADFQAPAFKANCNATLSVIDKSYVSVASGITGSGAKATYGLDLTPPRVTKMCFDDNTLTKGQTTKLHLDFSEKVYGLTASDLCMTGGKIANLTSVDGIKWTADFTTNETVKTGCSYTSKLTACSYTDCAGYAGNGAAVSFKAVTATVAKSYDDISAVNTFSVL